MAQDNEAHAPVDGATVGQSSADRGGAGGRLSEGSPRSAGALSPNAEGPHEDWSLDSLNSYLLHDDPDLQAVLPETRCQLDCVLATCPHVDGGSLGAEGVPGGSFGAEAGDRNELDDRMSLGLFGSTEVLTSVYNAQFDFREELYDDEQVLCELAIYPPMCNTVPDAPHVAE